MKIGFLITARLKSTRLPEKLLLELNGKSVIAAMVNRLKLATVVDNIVIATSTNPENDILVDIASDCGVDCFRGSESDVVARLLGASQSRELDYILNITADCPLVAYDYVPDMIAEYARTEADLITSFDLPHGLYVYGIKPAALAKVMDIKDQTNTEVWGGYFTDTSMFSVHQLPVPPEHQRDYRLTLDYPEDYEFFKQLYSSLGPNAYAAKTPDIIGFLDEHPEIVDVNIACEEKYKARWVKQKQIMKTR